MTKLLTIFFLLISPLLHAQNAWLSAYFTQVRGGKSAAIPAEVSKIEQYKGATEMLLSYLKDSSNVVRSQALALVCATCKQSQAATTRDKITSSLIATLRSNEGHMVSGAIRCLSQLNKTSFTKSHRDSLVNLIQPKQAYVNDIARLAGFFEIKEAEGKLQTLSQPGNTQSIRWAALLALARMGNADAIESVDSRVRKLSVNDDVVLEIFPDLIYTRQKKLIDYTIEVLQSNELRCESADNDNPQAIPCGYRIMEQLAVAIKGYPLSLDASGDIQTNDYKKSLETVREWFKSKNGNYEVDKTKF